MYWEHTFNSCSTTQRAKLMMLWVSVADSYLYPVTAYKLWEITGQLLLKYVILFHASSMNYNIDNTVMLLRTADVSTQQNKADMPHTW